MRNGFMMLVMPLLLLVINNNVGILVLAKNNYKEALIKSLVYFEAQRSGQLPANQRVTWRANSALYDGQGVGVNLVGGYYDAGDNVKFGFPMAFSMTLLSWGVVEFKAHLKAQGEAQNALAAIKWGTDYMIKAHPKPNLLYAGVGDGDADHQCWQRPEDMTTPRTVYKIDEQHPGSDLAGETAAAFAAASLAFRGVDDQYSQLLVTHAKQLFDYARNYQGKYSDSISSVAKFYSSSGFQDELLWAAAWLERATGEKQYRDVLNDSQYSASGTRSLFSWDDKFVGAQILATKLVLEGKEKWQGYKKGAEEFICNCIQKGNNNVVKTNGGLLWFDGFNNLQYTASASLALVVYADYLSSTNNNISCGSTKVVPSDLLNFALSQVDYILGSNPRSSSYMVGYGSNYPQKMHHRGASIVSIKKDPTQVGCKEGFDKWYNNNQPNPNVLVGAIVGGPDRNDNYADERSNFMSAQPPTVNNGAFVGVLARLSVLGKKN